MLGEGGNFPHPFCISKCTCSISDQKMQHKEIRYMKGGFYERDEEKGNSAVSLLPDRDHGGSGALPACKGSRLDRPRYRSRNSRRADTAVAVYCAAEYGGGDQPERDVPGQV